MVLILSSNGSYLIYLFVLKATNQQISVQYGKSWPCIFR